MKGIYKELQKPFGANVQNYIIAARTAQGFEELQSCTADEHADIISRWHCVHKNTKRKKNPGEEQLEALQTVLEKHRERRKRWIGKLKSKPMPMYPPATTTSDTASSMRDPGQQSSEGSSRHTPADTPDTSTSSLHHAHTFPGALHELPADPADTLTLQHRHPEADDEDADMEEAIRLSISHAQTLPAKHDAMATHTDVDEDELMERAIRASITELQEHPAGQDEDSDAALQRAMRASIAEASGSGLNEEEQRALEETLRKSVLETRMERRRQRRDRGTDSEWDTEDDEHDVDTEDDEEVKRAIEESRRHAEESTALHDHAHEEELKRAMEESHREEERKKSELERQRTEEEIVMEYVKRQSLAEEEHRRAMQEGRPPKDVDTMGEGSNSLH